MPRLLCTLVLLLGSLNCRAADPAQLALILYPQAAQWLPVAKLPAPTLARFDEIKWLLRKHYLEQLPTDSSEESPDCSFITRTLYEQNSTEHFYQADLNADGAPDVLYSGPAQCREGALSLIWYGAANGWFSGQVSRLDAELVFIQPQTKPQAVGFWSSCCGDPIQSLALGDMAQASKRENLPADLQLPSNALAITGLLTAKGGVTLRTSPERQDSYNQGGSENFRTAMFGNVSRRYLPSASLQQLQHYQDAQGARWLLVRMDKASEVLAVHNPLSVTIGWVEASCLQGPCSGPDFNASGP